MARKDDTRGTGDAAAKRRDRLRAALKANLQRRKAQARARGNAAQEESPDKGPEQREAE